MKKIVKWRIALTAACAIAACGALGAVTSVAADAQTEEENYYYKQLSPESQRFYRAIGAMETSGALKEGNAEYDLIANGVLDDGQLASFSRTSDVLMAFGAGRDAYLLDHPDLFYLDPEYLSLSVGRKNGVYVATMGTGRTDSYYAAPFENEEQVNEAFALYEEKLASLVSAAKDLTDDAEKVKSVNQKLVEGITYSFCSTASEQGTVCEAGYEHIRNVYGALVNQKCVCEGYARSFKAAMDELGIESVLVQGYAEGADSGVEPHMWNYVRLDGAWYGVDVTWNDGDPSSPMRYLLSGDLFMKQDHIPDGVVSDSGFEFRYPVLSQNDYGVTAQGGVWSEITYQEADGMRSAEVKVSYNGKNVKQLAEEGLYLSYRTNDAVNGGDTAWMSLYAINEMYDGGAFSDRDGYTQCDVLVNSYVQYIQFAVIDCAPDGTSGIYNKETFDQTHIISMGNTLSNETYGSYKAPPYVETLTPAAATPINVEKKYDISVTFTEALKKADETQEVGVKVVTYHDDTMNYASVSDVKWSADDAKKVTFTFEPSRQFSHRNESYSFYVTNLVGAESEKAPNGFSYLTEEPNIVCNKIYGDGRLYVKAYGEPSLIGSGDLSLDGFRTEDGGFIAENQRSQMLLVATKPTEKASQDMVAGAADKAGVSEDQILASETFELTLSICRNIVKIPNGSSVQVAFGFPAGYGPEDEGVKFKVYHYKKDEQGNIVGTEELDCVITQYGLVVSVSDFSPFAVIALPADAVNTTDKSVYVRTVGFGGKVKGAGIRKVEQGGALTLEATPDAGYRIDRILLNGEPVQTDGNALSLSYDMLSADNTVEVTFVSDRVAAYEQEQGIEHVYPSLAVQSGDAPAEGGAELPIYVPALIAAICIAVLAVAFVIIILLMRKRKKA